MFEFGGRWVIDAVVPASKHLGHVVEVELLARLDVVALVRLR